MVHVEVSFLETFLRIEVLGIFGPPTTHVVGEGNSSQGHCRRPSADGSTGGEW